MQDHNQTRHIPIRRSPRIRHYPSPSNRFRSVCRALSLEKGRPDAVWSCTRASPSWSRQGKACRYRKSRPGSFDHCRIRDNHVQILALAGVTDGDGLPVFVSPELGESDSTRHLRAILPGASFAETIVPPRTARVTVAAAIARIVLLFIARTPLGVRHLHVRNFVAVHSMTKRVITVQGVRTMWFVDAIAVFVKVVEAGSFSSAARRLGLPRQRSAPKLQAWKSALVCA